MPFTPNAELQCGNSWMYASFADSQLEPYKCIAPTAGKTRCCWRGAVSRDDFEKAEAALRKAKWATDSADRYEWVKEYVLLHCCKANGPRKPDHQGRLKYSPVCLDEVIRAYLIDIGGAQLTSQTSTDKAAPRGQDLPLPYFIPCPESEETIRSLILKDVPKYRDTSPQPTRQKTAEHGYVYAFIWPTYPSFVKVGFTGRNVQTRLDEQEQCCPGAKKSLSLEVYWPERMEGLIHIELAQFRHKMGKCQKCTTPHNEWFLAPVEEVNKVMTSWEDLIERERLYEDRKLTARWRERLSNVEGEITARRLLSVLDTEERLRREAMDAARDSEAARSHLVFDEEETSLAKLLGDLQIPGQEEAQVLSGRVDKPNVLNQEEDRAHRNQVEAAKSAYPTTIAAAEIAVEVIAEALDVVQQQIVEPLIQGEKPAADVTPPLLDPQPEFTAQAELMAATKITPTTKAAQDHDLTLTYFEDFMLLLAKSQESNRILAFGEPWNMIDLPFSFSTNEMMPLSSVATT